MNLKPIDNIILFIMVYFFILLLKFILYIILQINRKKKSKNTLKAIVGTLKNLHCLMFYLSFNMLIIFIYEIK